MEIKTAINDDQVIFYIQDKANRVAELICELRDNALMLEHTRVDSSLQGQGVGKRLIGAAVHFAAERELEISAVCPFAQKVLEG